MDPSLHHVTKLWAALERFCTQQQTIENAEWKHLFGSVVLSNVPRPLLFNCILYPFLSVTLTRASQKVCSNGTSLFVEMICFLDWFLDKLEDPIRNKTLEVLIA
eukprot:PhF_6_TR20147/c0_g1_i1/m.29269